MSKFLKWMGTLVVVFLLVFLGFGALGFWHKNEVKKTAEAIERINSRKITLTDVMGENLPAKPNEAVNNATVAGVDANNNAIRDDVELAIFEKYPNSAKIRAAMLQYAQALQLELTEVFNSETLIATIQKENLAYACLGDSSLSKDITIIDTIEEEISVLVVSTDLRSKRMSDNFKYMTGYGLPTESNCNLDIALLPN